MLNPRPAVQRVIPAKHIKREPCTTLLMHVKLGSPAYLLRMHKIMENDNACFEFWIRPNPGCVSNSLAARVTVLNALNEYSEFPKRVRIWACI